MLSQIVAKEQNKEFVAVWDGQECINSPVEEWCKKNMMKQQTMKSNDMHLPVSACQPFTNGWKTLVFKYLPRKKGYYIDGHEKPAIVEYQWTFVQRYLKNKLGIHCLIQVGLTEELEKANKFPKDSSYWYTDNNNQPMIEYHVDACEELQERLATETKFGGWENQQKWNH